MSQWTVVEKLVIFLVLPLLMNSSALARVVNSPDDEIRINAFQDHLDHLSQLERKRLSDVDQIKIGKSEWERKMALEAEIYRRQKALQEKAVDESGPKYEEYLQERQKIYNSKENLRENFIQLRDRSRATQLRHVGLSEESEYFLAENKDRVDWKRRKFSESTASTSSGGSSFGGSSSGYTPPSSSGGNFYEAPPAPPVPYEPQNWEIPPPPPPPMFEDDNPF